jgi:hypothetical protein
MTSAWLLTSRPRIAVERDAMTLNDKVDALQSRASELKSTFEASREETSDKIKAHRMRLHVWEGPFRPSCLSGAVSFAVSQPGSCSRASWSGTVGMLLREVKSPREGRLWVERARFGPVSAVGR